MPNTLAHLGVQSALTRSMLRDADVKWIYLGCIVPDVPWILQRVAWFAVPGIDRYDVRLYCIVQASLAGSLLLCAALALLSRTPSRTFGVLGVGSLLHLLLDAVQTKWGNGVHLLAPFSWRDLTIGWFWPESTATYALTALGVVMVAWLAWRGPPRLVGRPSMHPRRLLLSAGLLLAYVAAPLALRGGPAAADSHFTETLRHREGRAGKAIALDRATYLMGASVDSVRTYAGETLAIDRPLLEHSATVSLRGRFLDASTIAVDALHDHSGWPRDIPSYVGLIIVAVTWVTALKRTTMSDPRGTGPTAG